MKVALTNIGGSSPGTKPVSISILTAVLKQKGHDVALFDTTFMDLGFRLDTEVSDELRMFKPVDWGHYGLKRERIDARQEWLRFLDREQPDLIAASAFSDMYKHTLEFMKVAKERLGVPIIVGGIHTTLLPDEVIKEECVDAICVGEGEAALLEYIDALDGRNVTRTDIQNLCIKKDGKIQKNPLRPLAVLDDLPFFDYSLYDRRQFLRPYQGKVFRSGDFQDKRGCPRRCTYCAYAIINTEIYPRTRVAMYSPERFVEEALYLTKTWHLEFFKIFSEDIFVRHADDLAKISELWAKKVNIPFTTSGYPIAVTKKKVELLKKMNCVSISLALECGNAHYREHMLKRKYTNEQFEEAIRMVQDAGIRACSLNMVGLPRESRKMIFETIEANRKIRPDHADFGCFFPFRGTPLGDLAVADKFADPEEIKNSRSEHGNCILDMPQIPRDEVHGIIKVHHFYLYYPKVMWPIFALCEKKGRWRNAIYRMLLWMDSSLKRLGIDPKGMARKIHAAKRRESSSRATSNERPVTIRHSEEVS